VERRGIVPAVSAESRETTGQLQGEGGIILKIIQAQTPEGARGWGPQMGEGQERATARMLEEEEGLEEGEGLVERGSLGVSLRRDPSGRRVRRPISRKGRCWGMGMGAVWKGSQVAAVHEEEDPESAALLPSWRRQCILSWGLPSRKPALVPSLAAPMRSQLGREEAGREGDAFSKPCGKRSM